MPAVPFVHGGRRGRRRVKGSPFWVALLLGVFAAGTAGAPRTFEDALPTRGLNWPTAYNLARGETQIQLFAFVSPVNPLAFFEFEYGLSDTLQLGMRPVAALFGDVRAWGKVHVGTTGPVSLAIPFGFEVLIPAPSWSFYGGWVLSWRVLPFLSLHPGFSLAFSPDLKMEPYAGVHLDMGQNAKLVLEGDAYPPYISMGILVWAFGSVRIQIDTPLPTVQLRISVTGRF